MIKNKSKPQKLHAGQLRRLQKFVLLACGLLLVKTFLAILWEYRFYFPADFDSAFLSGRRYTFTFSYQVVFYTHIISAPIALAIGAILLAIGSRSRASSLHRVLGRIQIPLVLLLVAPSGFVMATQAYAGLIAAVGFALHAGATVIFAGLTMSTAIRGNLQSHRRWAMRCFLMLAAPLLFRIVAGAVSTAGLESEAFYQWNAWFSWMAPLAVFESVRLLSARTRLNEKTKLNPHSLRAST